MPPPSSICILQRSYQRFFSLSPPTSERRFCLAHIRALIPTRKHSHKEGKKYSSKRKSSSKWNDSQKRFLRQIACGMPGDIFLADCTRLFVSLGNSKHFFSASVITSTQSTVVVYITAKHGYSVAESQSWGKLWVGLGRNLLVSSLLCSFPLLINASTLIRRRREDRKGGNFFFFSPSSFLPLCS